MLDTRGGTGLSGTFSSGVARTFAVTGHGGVPTGAVAVTGNLTVTGQTSPGFVALTPNPVNNPDHVTLNFPLGDNRANGVTVALSGTGTLSATYMGEVGTATTHLIFDVTGYFMTDTCGATYVSLTPARILDSRPDGTGLSGTFSSGVARTFAVTGARRGPLRRGRGHRQPDRHQADEPGLRGPHARSHQQPHHVDPQLPARGQPGQRGDRGPVGDRHPQSPPTWARSAPPPTHLIFDVTGYFVTDTSGATYVSLAPARILDTRPGGTGLSGTFSSGVARTFAVTGHGGVPTDAVAVTGNLTVTSQTSPGFVALTPAPTNSPTTSTLNFPLGDNRANGVTVALVGDRHPVGHLHGRGRRAPPPT